MSQSKQRIALLIAVVIPLVVGVLARTTGIRIPAAVHSGLDIGLMVLGVMAILGAILLKFQFVQPGQIWGQSSAGNFLIGAACFSWGIAPYLSDANNLRDFAQFLGLIMFFLGLRLNTRARRLTGPSQ